MRYTSYHFWLSLKPSDLALSDAFDILSAYLVQIGFDSFVPEGESLEAFVPTDQASDEAVDQILKDLPLSDLVFAYKSEQLIDKNWNEEWEQYYFTPINIDGRCYVRAPFHPPAPAAMGIELIISPKMAFGTGHHQTTTLILRHLLHLADVGWIAGRRVIDVGCGSGILGILAAKLGAASVQAIDIDNCCVDSTRENASINGVASHLQESQGDAASLDPSESYDLILANITLNINLTSLPGFVRVLAPQGMILCSGFFYSDVPQIEERILGMGLKLERVCSLTSPSGDQWAMVVLQRIS